MLPSVKWADSVNTLVKSLSASCMTFIQQRFHDTLHSAKYSNGVAFILSVYYTFFCCRFKSLCQIDTWSLGSIEAIIFQAATNLPVEQACLSYLALEKINDELLKLGEDQQPLDPVYVDFIKRLFKAVENRLIQRVGMATKCSAWNAIPKTKQISIMQMGFFDPLETHSKNSPEVRTPRSSLRRNHSLNASMANSGSSSNSRAPNVVQPAGPLRRTSLRATIHGERNPISAQAAARTTGTPHPSGIPNVQPSNRRVPETPRPKSMQPINVSASRANPNRVNSNPVGKSCPRRVNATVSRTPITR